MSNASPSLEVCGAFLDLSKVFDRVYHKGLLYKPKIREINGNRLDLVASFLYNRCQRVALNGQSCNWKFVKASVPQGTVWWPLFFLFYVNDSVKLTDSQKYLGFYFSVMIMTNRAF